jgi:hypothetical protein
VTDDELLTEVTAMCADGSRGEVEELEGTPAGTYLASFSRPLPVFNDAKMSLGFVAAAIRIRDAFTQLNPNTGMTSTGPAGMENAAHPA